MNPPRITCRTPNGIIRAPLADLDELRAFVCLHPNVREYFLDWDGRTDRWQFVEPCPTWNEPYLSVVDDRYRIPPGLPLTELSDLTGFIRAHPCPAYRLEIDGRVFVVEDVGRLE